MAERRGFVLRVKPDRVEEYVEAHRQVWPEMLDALRAAGIRNYTIFRAGTRCSATSKRTTSTMPDGGPPPLEEVFRLS